MSMEINVLIDGDFEGCPEAGWLQSIAEHAIGAEREGTDVEMGLVITSKERVHELNRNYRGRDEPTDVLSFSAWEEVDDEQPPFVQPPDGVLHLGEVIISYPQAVAQAVEHHHSAKKEIAILIIHGVLHLLGYDHDKPELESEMRARETDILSSIEGRLE